MNFGNCCIRAQKANSSIRTFSKENMTVKVSGIIVDAHLIPMKFRTARRQPLKICYNAESLGGCSVMLVKIRKLIYTKHYVGR